MIILLLIILSHSVTLFGSYKDVPVYVARFSNISVNTTWKPQIESQTRQPYVYDQRSKSVGSAIFNRMDNYSWYQQEYEKESRSEKNSVVKQYRNNPILNQHWQEGQSLYDFRCEKKLDSEVNLDLSDNPVQLLVSIPVKQSMCDVLTVESIESIKTSFKTLLESNNSFSTVKAIHDLLHSSIEHNAYKQQWNALKENLSLIVCNSDASIKLDLSINDKQLVTQLCADFCKTISGSPAEWYDTLLSINSDSFQSTIINDINSRSSFLNSVKTQGGVGQAFQCVKNSSQSIIHGIKNLQRGCTPKSFLKKAQTNEINQKLGHVIKLAENNKSNEAVDYIKTTQSLLPYSRITSGLQKNKINNPLTPTTENNLNNKQEIVDKQDSLLPKAIALTKSDNEQNLVKNKLGINGLPNTEESVHKIAQWDYGYNAPVIAKYVNLSKHQKKYNYHIESSLRNQIAAVIEQNFDACKSELSKYEQTSPLVLNENHEYAQQIINRRKEALSFVKEHGSLVYEQNYELSAESKWLLNQKKENQRVLEYCIGNAVQQVIHAEVVEIFNKVSELSFKKNFSDPDKKLNDKIADYLLHTAKINLEGHASKALVASNFCWSLFEYGQTVSKHVGRALNGGFNEIAIAAQNVANQLYTLAESTIFSDTNRVLNPIGSSIAHTLKKALHILDEFRIKAGNVDANSHDQIVLIGECLRNLCCEVPKNFIEQFYSNQTLAAECTWLAIGESIEVASAIVKNPEHFVINTAQGFIAPFHYAADLLFDLSDIALSVENIEQYNARIGELYGKISSDVSKFANIVIASSELPVQEKAKLLGRIVTEGLLINKGLSLLSNSALTTMQAGRLRAEKVFQELQEVNAVAQTAEGFAVESKIPAQFMEVEKISNSIGKLVVSNQQLEEYIAAVLKDSKLLSEYLTKFHLESIISTDKVTQGTRLFKEVNGFLGKDGPLYKILKTATKTLDDNDLNTARGAIYELEKALALESNGQKVIYFGKKLPGNKTCEFDIETLSKLIECKDRYWQIITPKKMQTMKSRFIEQKKNANAYGKIFEVHSKQPIPEYWQKWFVDNGISFVEG